MIREKYTYVTDKDAQWQCIGLTEKAGFYQGVVYRYGKVSIPQTEEMTQEGDLPFRFEYDIVDSNGLEQIHPAYDVGGIMANQSYEINYKNSIYYFNFYIK